MNRTGVDRHLVDGAGVTRAHPGQARHEGDPRPGEPVSGKR
jgi:hypothetical protein